MNVLGKIKSKKVATKIQNINATDSNDNITIAEPTQKLAQSFIVSQRNNLNDDNNGEQKQQQLQYNKQQKLFITQQQQQKVQNKVIIKNKQIQNQTKHQLQQQSQQIYQTKKSSHQKKQNHLKNQVIKTAAYTLDINDSKQKDIEDFGHNSLQGANKSNAINHKKQSSASLMKSMFYLGDDTNSKNSSSRNSSFLMGTNSRCSLPNKEGGFWGHRNKSFFSKQDKSKNNEQDDDDFDEVDINTILLLQKSKNNNNNDSKNAKSKAKAKFSIQNAKQLEFLLMKDNPEVLCFYIKKTYQMGDIYMLQGQLESLKLKCINSQFHRTNVKTNGKSTSKVSKAKMSCSRMCLDQIETLARVYLKQIVFLSENETMIVPQFVLETVVKDTRRRQRNNHSYSSHEGD